MPCDLRSTRVDFPALRPIAARQPMILYASPKEAFTHLLPMDVWSGKGKELEIGTQVLQDWVHQTYPQA